MTRHTVWLDPAWGRLRVQPAGAGAAERQGWPGRLTGTEFESTKTE